LPQYNGAAISSRAVATGPEKALFAFKRFVPRKVDGPHRMLTTSMISTFERDNKENESMKENNRTLIPAVLLIPGMTLPGSAIFGFFAIIAFVNAGIGLRAESDK
jgi:hypothetical protein